MHLISKANLPASAQVIREELERVLASREFRASHRCCDLLSYVVESVLKGHGDTLKERTIGIDVFGRTAEYDPSNDATVRVKAGEVRKRLALYYASPEGADDPIVIELPIGAYTPLFHDRENEHPPVALTPPQFDFAQATAHQPLDTCDVVSVLPASPALPPGRTWRSSKSRMALLIVALLAFSGILVSIYEHYRAPKVALIFDQFWAPVFQSNESALLCVTPVPIYSLKFDATPKVAPKAEDFVVIRDQFVAIGDLNAASKIAAALEQARRPVRVRTANVSFEELKKAPTILVGFSYSRWKEVSKGLRFFIDLDRKPSYAVLDNGAPTDWHIATYPDDPALAEDYAVITRVLDPDTGQMLVEIAGISHYGTEGAADVLTNPSLLAQALHNAPSDWPKKNIQIVLHMKVISGTPAAPSVVASYFW